jgi:hypothetical protein
MQNSVRVRPNSNRRPHAAADLPGKADAAPSSTPLNDASGKQLLQRECSLSWVKERPGRAGRASRMLQWQRGLTPDARAAQALVMRDLSLITGDPVKFGLGFVSLFYDVVLMTQHYIIYAPARSAGRAPAHQKARPRAATAGPRTRALGCTAVAGARARLPAAALFSG